MQKITKEWFQGSVHGQWTKSLLDVPNISKEEIMRYVVDRRSERKISLKEVGLRTLKSVKAYRFFMDGHVQKLSVCCSNASQQDLMILRAKVWASMKQIYFKMYMAVEEEQGRVAGAYCECVAGYVNTNVSILLSGMFMNVTCALKMCECVSHFSQDP